MSNELQLDKSDWKPVTFGEVVKEVMQSTKDPVADGIERVVGLEHIEPECIHLRNWASIEEETTFTKTFRKGHVLFGRRRAYLKKAARAEFHGICSGDITVMEAKKGLLPELLPFLVCNDKFFDYAVQHSAGGLSPRTKFKDLANYEFLLPPKDQQAKLAELLWAADEVASAADAAFEKSDKARRSFLRQSFAHRHEFETRRVADVGEVKMGRQRAPKYQTGNFTKPYLRVANVFDCFFDYSDVLSMDFDERDFETFRLRKGDILLNEGQSRELVGRCAIYDGAIDDCCFQNTLIRYRAGKGLLSEYAFAYFQFCFNFGRFSAISGQTTSVAHLGADRFGSLRLPIPPKDIQRKIAENDEQMRRVTAEQKFHREICRQLLKSLINQIF